MAKDTTVNPQITDLVTPKTVEKPADVVRQPAEDENDPPASSTEPSED